MSDIDKLSSNQVAALDLFIFGHIDELLCGQIVSVHTADLAGLALARRAQLSKTRTVIELEFNQPLADPDLAVTQILEALLTFLEAGYSLSGQEPSLKLIQLTVIGARTSLGVGIRPGKKAAGS